MTTMARILLAACVAVSLPQHSATSWAGEDWPQFKFDSRHSGDAPQRSVNVPLGLVAAVPLTDAVFTSPAIAAGRVYVLDGSGVLSCLDAKTLAVLWKFATPGEGNVNNVCSPAVAEGYVHFGTMAGTYYVLDAASGRLAKEIPCGEPVFSTPVVAAGRVYFATLGSKVYALKPNGDVCWTWDYVKERLGFTGDRWSAEAWCKHRGGRTTWRDQFCCSRDIAAFDKTLVIPAGGETIWLDDGGEQPLLVGSGQVPNVKGDEFPATFGLSIDSSGAVYRQWHRRDNSGRVEILRYRNGKFETDFVRGTMVRNDLPGLIGVTSVSLRGQDVYRCRPEEGFGFCKHASGQEEPLRLAGGPSIASPILLRDAGVYGGLDGKLWVVPLSGKGPAWSFATAFGKAISAPAAVCDGRIYFGCDDGYLYVLGAEGKAPLPTDDLGLSRVRSPLLGKRSGAEYDWFTNFGDFQNTNANQQELRPPLAMKWIRRYEGTFKHLPVCGGGRMYTHTAEGQIFAVEQATGRLLWRQYFPGVYVSYTSPLYYQERLLVPQAGLEKCRLRCLDAASGKLLWEVPFAGSPSWSRQQPPVVYTSPGQDRQTRSKSLVIYMFGTGQFAPKEKGDTFAWLYSHDNPAYPAHHRPMLKAWDFETGKEVWSKDFSEYGSGGDDAGVCLMDGTLYYSCFFGYAAVRQGQPGPKGITAALDPATGQVRWLSTRHSVTAGCTISADRGRLYVGGYNAADSKTGPRHVWCLDARDGSLIWESEPLTKSINVVTIGKDFLFAYAYGGDSYLLDKSTGKIRAKFNKRYACTRFSLCEPYLLGSNMDLIDTSRDNAVVSSGPPIDLRECVGSVVSNGRLFYITQANGLQVSQASAAEETAGRQPGPSE
jgi:outer membrane protein assembly factor BamB